MATTNIVDRSNLSALPAVPDTVDPAVRDIMTAFRNEIIRLSGQLDGRSNPNPSLVELLGGTAATQPGANGSLGPVTGIRIESFENYIAFYLASNGGNQVELWRGVGTGAESSSAQRVMVTSGLSLEDYPPAGESYRYWLRYASGDGLRFGPFTPPRGIQYSSADLANPETIIAGSEGTIYLETFEDEDFNTNWVERAGNTPTITYPLSGVVGGKVARVDAAEAWRVAPDILAFEPDQLYRMKIGLRLSAAPGNGSTATRAQVRAGWECMDASKAILDTGGGSSYLSAHWFCAFDIDLGAVSVGTYQTFTGYLNGLGATPANNASSVSAPSVARTGTKYWRPVVVVNYDGGNGTTEIDYIRVDALNPLDVAFGGELTNEAVTLPADASGNVLSYAGAGGTFNLRYGMQPIPAASATYSIISNPNSLTASIDTAGVFSVTGAFSAGLSAASITLRATYQGVSIDRVFSLAKAYSGTNGTNGSNGTNGLNSALIYIFRRSASAPALPSASTTYTFATGVLTGLDGGWTQTIPAADGNPLYVSVATASASGATDTIASGEWSSVSILAQDGSPGASGLSAASLYIYQRATSTPALPSATATFTFATGALTGLNNGWTATIPAGTDPIYVSTATAASTGATDNIASGEWAAAQILSQNGVNGSNGSNGTNGTNGTNGSNGLSTALVTVYQRAASVPAVPSATVTFTFATGGISGLDGGWVATPPAGSNPLYVTVASASSSAATDTIATGEWASPVLLVQDGAAGSSGSNGLNAATIFVYQRAASAPALPSASVTYTFATGSAAGLNNGWSQTIPANDGNPLWVSTATAASSSATDVISSGEWAATQKLAENGANGSNGTNGTNGTNGAPGADGADGADGAPGLNNATVLLYKRSATTPSVPSTTSTYTFATGVLTGHDNGWVQSVPTTDGNPLYVTLALASGTGATDTIATGEWTAPAILASDGAPGGSQALLWNATISDSSVSGTSEVTIASISSPSIGAGGVIRLTPGAVNPTAPPVTNTTLTIRIKIAGTTVGEVQLIFDSAGGLAAIDDTTDMINTITNSWSGVQTLSVTRQRSSGTATGLTYDFPLIIERVG